MSALAKRQAKAVLLATLKTDAEEGPMSVNMEEAGVMHSSESFLREYRKLCLQLSKMLELTE